MLYWVLDRQQYFDTPHSFAEYVRNEYDNKPWSTVVYWVLDVQKRFDTPLLLC